MLKIGSHVSFSKKGLLNATEEALGYGSSSFMIYTGAPQNTRRKPMEKQYVPEGLELMKANGIDDIVVHAPYIINLGSYKKNTYQLAIDFLKSEIDRTAFIGVKNIVLHPGAYTDKDAAYGIDRIAEGLNEVLTSDQTVNIALETMAGKGTEIGRTFEELAAIIDKVTHNDKLTICLDTCHVHDAGYDIVNDFDGVIEQFDRIIGLERLAVLHVNDSKNFRGAAKDRHAPLGSGLIGFHALYDIVNHDVVRDIPIILETPWIGKEKARQRPMYEAEIALLSDNAEQRFGANFYEDVEKLQHFCKKESLDSREFIVGTWQLLQDKKQKKADKREPMERLYDLVTEAELFPDYTEEQINHRLVALFAQK
ncbi:deoxyribonuclease IV [Numidum massiliense]|uniref:deoxyribonuclease IV n=1 Tax=Numidum massiliense TaxID=1522315 RepID=UPI0006D587FB|nr:deoxyribonuclease IV [Numidum massiliense]